MHFLEFLKEKRNHFALKLNVSPSSNHVILHIDKVLEPSVPVCIKRAWNIYIFFIEQLDFFRDNYVSNIDL